MKHFSKFLVLTVVSSVVCFLSSCINTPYKNQHIETVEKLQVNSPDDLLGTINSCLSENNESFYAVKILSFTSDKQSIYELQTLTYLDQNNITREFGIFKLLNKYTDNKDYKEVTKIKIYCTGDCDCGLEGIMGAGDESYVQCKCKDCQMHYISDEDTKLNFYGKEYKFNIKQIIKEDDIRFKTIEPVITSIRYAQYKGDVSVFVEYANKEKTMVGSFALTYQSKLEKAIIINCEGACGCTERYYPETGAIECTCSPCEMKVKPLTELKKI